MKKKWPIINRQDRFTIQKINSAIKAIKALEKILSYAKENNPRLFKYLMKNFPLFSVINTRKETDPTVFIE